VPVWGAAKWEKATASNEMAESAAALESAVAKAAEVRVSGVAAEWVASWQSAETSGLE
jgi:hypothetical protein